MADKNKTIEGLQSELDNIRKREEKARKVYVDAREYRISLEKTLGFMSKKGVVSSKPQVTEESPPKRRRSSPIRDLSLSIVQEAPGEIRVKDLESELATKGIKVNGGTGSWVLKKLADEGLITKVRYGIYRKKGPIEKPA